MSSGKQKRGNDASARRKNTAKAAAAKPAKGQPAKGQRGTANPPAGGKPSARRTPARPARSSAAAAGARVAAGASAATAVADRSGLRHDSLVVGRTPPLARVAGALGVLTGVALLVRPFLPLGTAGGHRIGTGLGALGIIGWIPAALVLIVAGAAAAAGRLPRLGLAAIGAAGGLAIGAGVRWVWLTDTSARTPIDLPLPGQAVSLGGYAVGSGLVLAIVGAAAGVLALICSYLAWGSTVMDDDGRFDGWRPAFGSAGLIVGAFGAIAFGTAPSSSAVGASPGGALQATGWLRASDLIFIAALVLTCALAPTLRPRVAVVGAWVAVGVVLLGTAIENIVVVDRSPDLHTTLGTVAQPIAAGLVLVLALAAALVRPRPTPETSSSSG